MTCTCDCVETVYTFKVNIDASLGSYSSNRYGCRLTTVVFSQDKRKGFSYSVLGHDIFIDSTN